MADTTIAIKQEFKNPELTQTRVLTVKSGVTLYEGQIVCIDASGLAVNAATNLKVAGIAKSTIVGDGTKTIELFYGCTYKIAKSTAAATDVGLTAYASDNQTCITSSNTAILGPIQSVADTGHLYVNLTLRA